LRGLLQMAIIFALWMAGEMISRGLQIPIPGSIIGMVLLFVFLVTGVIRLQWIEEASNFLLDNMGILFVPFGVSLLAMTDVLGSNLLALAVIVPVSVVLVMGVSGLLVQYLVEKEHD